MSMEPSTRNAKSTTSAGTHNPGERKSGEMEKAVSAPSSPGSIEAVRAFQVVVSSSATVA